MNFEDIKECIDTINEKITEIETSFTELSERAEEDRNVSYEALKTRVESEQFKVKLLIDAITRECLKNKDILPLLEEVDAVNTRVKVLKTEITKCIQKPKVSLVETVYKSLLPVLTLVLFPHALYFLSFRDLGLPYVMDLTFMVMIFGLGFAMFQKFGKKYLDQVSI